MANKKQETNSYFFGFFEKCSVLIMHDRVIITEKNGKKHLFRMGFNEEPYPRKDR